jgi:hypothetical protein
VTQSGAIWLSDLQHANDPKELQLGEIAEQVLSELIEKEVDRPDWQAAYNQISFRLNRLRPRFGVHSFSLSLKSDQLPMWQEYTDRGRGYCIGFRPTAFNHMPVRVQKVAYVNPTDLQAIYLEIEEIARPLVGHHDDFLKEIAQVTQLLCRITSVKDDSWEHENEVRLIFSSMARPNDFEGKPSLPVALLPDGTNVYPDDPLLRERDGIKVPYFAKPFGRMRAGVWSPSGAIGSVIIGPNNSRSEDEVAQYLSDKGYVNFNVSKSRCSFRP